MKKIINGKVYDTEKAAQKASYNNGRYGDFAYLSETLYLKKTGEYFLHGEGGAQTRYAGRTGNMYHDGEAIVPVSYQEAKEWAEKHLSGAEYEAIFGEVVEEGGKEAVTLYLPSALLARLRREAQEKGVNIGAIVEGKLQ